MQKQGKSTSSATVDVTAFQRWDEELFGLMNQCPQFRPNVHWRGEVSVDRVFVERGFSPLCKLADELIEFIASAGQANLETGAANGRIVAWARQVCGPKRIDQESSRCEINVFALIRAALRSTFIPHIYGDNWRTALQDDFDDMIQQLEWFPEFWCGAIHSSLIVFEPCSGTPPPDSMRRQWKITPDRSETRQPPFYWGQDHWVECSVKRFLYALPEGEFDRDDRLDRNFKQPIGRAWFGLVNACSQGRDDGYLLALRQDLVAQLRQWFAVVKEETPQSGWQFLEGEATFRGIRFEIQGAPWRLLKKLAEKPGRPIGKSQLLDEIANDGGTGEEALRTHLTRIRQIIRSEFSLSNERDPLPNVERGQNAAWKLDEKVFPSASQIKR